MKTKILFFSIVIVVFLASCQKDEINQSQDLSMINGEELLIPSTATLVDEKSVIQSDEAEVIEAEEFAKLLATSINSKEVRKFLKDEANKKFDGDFDILVSNVLNSNVGKSTFKEKVEGSSSLGLAKGKGVFANAIKNPKLNISVPINIEKWDDTKQQVLVAVAVGIVDGETKNVKAYDSKGRLYMLDAKTEPNVPVIVVGNNERMDNQELVFDNKKSARVSGNAEVLYYLRCPDLNAIESWWRGAPEIRIDIVVYNDDFSAAFLAACWNWDMPSRMMASDGGYLRDFKLFNWYFDENHGPDYFLQSWEIDDDGTTQKLTIGVTAGKKDVATGTASYELTYKAEDKRLAGQLIHYSSTVPFTVSDGLIELRIKNIPL
jgi:hypothetical protein